jgi:Protein of unknown function (DUF2442)
MTTSELNNKLEAKPIRAVVKARRLIVDLEDGRTISTPLAWYPRLAHGTPKELANVELWDDGMHWEDLNESLSVKGLLLGNKSGEGEKSFQRWLGYRARGEKEPIAELPLPPGMAKELEKIWAAEERRKPKSRPRRAG